MATIAQLNTTYKLNWAHANIVAGDSPYTCDSTKVVIEATVTAGAIVLNLPDNEVVLPNQVVIVVVRDPTTTGNACTITPEAGATVNGAANVAVTGNGTLRHCIRTSTTTWVTF